MILKGGFRLRNRIVLKVKHLVMILVTIFVFLPFSAVYLMPQLELGIVTYKHRAGKIVGKEVVLELLESKLFDFQKYELIGDYLIAGEWMDEYEIYIGPSMSTSTHAEEKNMFKWEEKEAYVEQYLKFGPIDYNLKNAAVELATVAARNHDETRIKEVYTLAKERLQQVNDPFLQGELELSFIKLYLQYGDLTKAKEMLAKLVLPEDQSYLQAEKTKYEALSLLLNGQGEEALEKVQTGLEQYEKAWEEEGNEDPIEYSVIYEDLKRLESQLVASSGYGNVTTVSGNVSRLDGTPIPLAGVFLREASRVNTSVRPDEFYQVKTDQNGNFTFHNVIPGDYQIFVGFTTEQIDGYTWPVELDDWLIIDGSEEVTYDITIAPLIEVIEPANETVVTSEEIDFHWEPVERAAYYELGFQIEREGVIRGFILDERIEGNKVTLPIEKIYNMPSVGIFDAEDIENEYFDPVTLLGFENPDGRYSWNVLAYDVEGNLLTRSDGYRLGKDTIGNLPTMYLQHRELTREDELLVDGKLEEALDGYLEIIEKDPTDTHSLRMITRLIGMQAGGDFAKVESLQHPYKKRLAELTDDTYYHFDVLYHYYSKRDWENYQNWLEEHFNPERFESNLYMKAIHANALMFQGKYEEAATLHKEALKMGGYHSSIGELLALEMYLDKDMEEVYALALEYPYAEYVTGREGASRWINIIHEIKKISEEDKEEMEVLKEGLEYYFTENEKALEQWKNRSPKSAFLMAIQMLEEN